MRTEPTLPRGHVRHVTVDFVATALLSTIHRREAVVMRKNAFIPHALDVLLTARYDRSRRVCLGVRLYSTRTVPALDAFHRVATLLAEGVCVGAACDVIIAEVVLPQLGGANVDNAIVVGAAFSF